MPKSAQKTISASSCPRCGEVLQSFAPVDEIDLGQCARCSGVWIPLDAAAKLWPVFEHTGPWIQKLIASPSAILRCPDCNAPFKVNRDILSQNECNFCPIGHGLFLSLESFDNALTGPTSTSPVKTSGQDTAEVEAYQPKEYDITSTQENDLSEINNLLESEAPAPLRSSMASIALQSPTAQPARANPETGIAEPLKQDSLPPLRYSIQGRELQFLRLVLPPGVSVVAQQAGFLFATDEIEVTRVDESFHLGDRYISYSNRASEHLAAISFSVPVGGSLVVLDFSEFLDGFRVNRDALLCLEKTVNVAPGRKHFGKHGELTLHHLSGKGHFFVSVLGVVSRIRLKRDERLHVEVSSVVGVTPEVSLTTGSSHREDLLQCEGPGEIWIQSHSISRLKKFLR